MKIPKLIVGGALVLFGIISFVAWFKSPPKAELSGASTDLSAQVVSINGSEAAPPPPNATLIAQAPSVVGPTPSKPAAVQVKQPSAPALPAVNFPEADRVQELFSTTTPNLPIVKTITYSKKTPWLQNRIAWLVDYANHYKTSRYFISRSLAGKPDYLYQTYANGDRFNVFNPDKKFHFYMLVDASRKKLALYYIDDETNERVHLKSYPVGLGRLDASRSTGMLTPLGRYSLGNKTAVYKPGDMGIYNKKKTEMIRVFGTRWIPFDQEISNCSAPARGYGIHGTPWTPDPSSQKLVDMHDGLNGNESDGCLRMRTEDINEIFAIVTSHYTEIEIVNDFFTTELPGKEGVSIR